MMRLHDFARERGIRVRDEDKRERDDDLQLRVAMVLQMRYEDCNSDGLLMEKSCCWRYDGGKDKE